MNAGGRRDLELGKTATHLLVGLRNSHRHESFAKDWKVGRVGVGPVRCRPIGCFVCVAHEADARVFDRASGTGLRKTGAGESIFGKYFPAAATGDGWHHSRGRSAI